MNSEPHNAIAHALLAIHDLLAERLLPGGTEADEWVEVDNWSGLPTGTRVRLEWVRGVEGGDRRFFHRDIPHEATTFRSDAESDQERAEYRRALARATMTVAREKEKR